MAAVKRLIDLKAPAWAFAAVAALAVYLCFALIDARMAPVMQRPEAEAGRIK